MKVVTFTSLAVSTALALAPALYASEQQTIVHSLGVTSLLQAQQRSATGQYSTSIIRPREALRAFPKPRTSIAAGAAAALATNSDSYELPVVGPDAAERGFTGITAGDAAKVDGFTLEPPDQGLATNDSQVFEAVNLAFRIYSTGGVPLTDNIDFAGFFAVLPGDNSTSSNYLSDPRVFFDPQSRRFFLSILEYQVDNATGAYLGSQDLLAVSQTSDAKGNYYIYSIDTSTRSQKACSPGCLADQPLIGVNDDGFYFSNNQFFFNGKSFGFVGALITALNKEALLHNTAVHGVSYLLPNDFSVEPSLPAPGSVTTQQNGVEFFTESLDNGPPANGKSLRIFALTNTESLEQSVIAPKLSTADFKTEAYSAPVPANQKAGSYPLGQHFGEPEEHLDGGDDRMLQVTYANGKLYTSLNTQLQDSDSNVPRTGAAWFVIAPEFYTPNTVSAHIVEQGYIGIANGSILYPAFVVNSAGDGIIGFSFSGTSFYPSAGYVHYTAGVVEQKVHTAGAGQGPEDGFTGYTVFGGGGVSRWGDYSAATISPLGHLWFASEYIPNDITHPRTPYTNWGTFISRVQ